MFRILTLTVLLGLLAGLLASQPMTLEYLGRYNCQPGPDHLMGTLGLSGDRALVGGNRGIALVDLKALPVGGTRNYLDLVSWGNPRDFTMTRDEKFVFVNSHLTGFTVLQIVNGKLTQVTTKSESGVYYEKMWLDGNFLYVAAHSFGIRIFDVTQPASPVLLGRIDKGFVDAFAIAVDGNTAYVADGGGGLKIVDVTDKKAPKIVSGETLPSAVGTYEGITVRNGRVYVAAGGAGLVVYEAGKLASRTVYPVQGCAESLCWIGDHLAVGTLEGVLVYEIGAGTAVKVVASDTSHRRGSSASLRIAEDVAAAGNRLLVADWNYMEMYELKPASTGTQPDIECDAQRIRFLPSGGRCRVTVRNNGQGTLNITSVTSSGAEYTVNYNGGSLAPGKSVSFDITYQGGGSGYAVIRLACNDPDENPLPIQVFGGTSTLDPGEPAPDFTLPTLIRDPKTNKLNQGTFTLSKHLGQAIWFSVDASW
jgi:hypothetical protein